MFMLEILRLWLMRVIYIAITTIGVGFWIVSHKILSLSNVTWECTRTKFHAAWMFTVHTMIQFIKIRSCIDVNYAAAYSVQTSQLKLYIWWIKLFHFLPSMTAGPQELVSRETHVAKVGIIPQYSVGQIETVHTVCNLQNWSWSPFHVHLFRATSRSVPWPLTNHRHFILTPSLPVSIVSAIRLPHHWTVPVPSSHHPHTFRAIATPSTSLQCTVASSSQHRYCIAHCSRLHRGHTTPPLLKVTLLCHTLYVHTLAAFNLWVQSLESTTVITRINTIEICLVSIFGYVYQLWSSWTIIAARLLHPPLQSTSPYSSPPPPPFANAQSPPDISTVPATIVKAFW